MTMIITKTEILSAVAYKLVYWPTFYDDMTDNKFSGDIEKQAKLHRPPFEFGPHSDILDSIEAI